MLSFWALRARSYKTKAEVQQQGHRPPSSPRGFSGFCLASRRTDSGGRKQIKKFLWSQEAFRHGPSVIGLCSRRVLAAAQCRNSQSCLAGPSKPPENKIAADGSKKRLPWSHNDILRLVIGSAPILWRTALNFVESRLHSAQLKPAWLCAHLHEISGSRVV